jgi:hypothetical protein
MIEDAANPAAARVAPGNIGNAANRFDVMTVAHMKKTGHLPARDHIGVSLPIYSGDTVSMS